MKLNLLPTYVGKERAAKSAIFLSFILAAAGIGAAVLMITTSRAQVTETQTRINDLQPRAAQAVAVSKSADVVIQNARVVILNSNLAAAMNKHNSTYTDLYDNVRRYIPTFFRVTSMSAQPAGENAVVTLAGVLQTQQQYADLMMALMRIPGATQVSRSGYQIVERYVPPLSEGSQSGAPVPRGSQALPDDPLERLDFYINQPKTEGFLNQGGFGTSDITQPKGSMPDWSQITVNVTIPGNIQTPNPRATLGALAGAGGTTPAGGIPSGPGFTPPGAPAGRPGGVPPPGDTGEER